MGLGQLGLYVEQKQGLRQLVYLRFHRWVRFIQFAQDMTRRRGIHPRYQLMTRERTRPGMEVSYSRSTRPQSRLSPFNMPRSNPSKVIKRTHITQFARTQHGYLNLYRIKKYSSLYM